ncbi:hypothetical protein [Lichenihabitans psoromatis]|uniref:hypothetical protein n=1 Tax=Lichenihabitans psoromatis TaxID=2528642 RepID=UPI001FDED507|nr:hypothetical protein [Lichenihabitans psoromatis]
MMRGEPQILVPYDAREAVCLKEAAAQASRSQTTVKSWCALHYIGRRVAGGPWQVSRVALAMLLDGDRPALQAYLSGDRAGSLVTPYFDRAGLSKINTDRRVS